METHTILLETKILTYISNNQPVTRKQVLNEFQAYAQNTVYRRLRTLEQKKRIHVNKDNQIIIEGTQPDQYPHLRTFKIPKHLTTFENTTFITNAYANQYPPLLALTEDLVKNPQQVTNLIALLVDMLIIHQLAINGEFKLHDLIKEPRPVDKEWTDKRIAQLQALLSQEQIITDLIINE